MDVFNGIPIVITTRKTQNRKHRKKRINKKWAKTYGYSYYETQEHEKIVLVDNVLYMTEKTFTKLKQGVGVWEKIF